MKRPRLRLSTVMWAVAAVGVLLGVQEMRRRRAHCEFRVLQHTVRAGVHELFVEDLLRDARAARGRGDAAEADRAEAEAEVARSEGRREHELRRAYERVVSRPWLSLPPVD